MAVKYLNIIENILKFLNIYMTIIKDEEMEIPDFDLGVRKMLLSETAKEFF